MPITAARRMYSPIAVRPIPTDRAITRSLAPQAYFRRRTSRTFRIDNLSAGIRPPFANRKGSTLPGSDCRQRSPNHPINRVAAFVRIRWPLSIGLGGRLPSESVAALPRILQGGAARNHPTTILPLFSFPFLSLPFLSLPFLSLPFLSLPLLSSQGIGRALLGHALWHCSGMVAPVRPPCGGSLARMFRSLGRLVGAIPFLFPRLAGLLSDDGVVEPSIRALDVAAQRAFFDFEPTIQVTAVTSKAGKEPVIFRQARRRNLMPRSAPQYYSRAKFISVQNHCGLAVAQPHYVERHIRKIAQIAVCWREWLWVLVHAITVPVRGFGRRHV